MISITDIETAQTRLADRVRHTPVLELSNLNRPLATGARITLKLECLQVSGSFKARGAMNRCLGVAKSETAAGIVTASGGNHGLAVARTAHVMNVPAAVFVPQNVSPAKVDKMRKWGARVDIVGDDWSETNETALEFAEREGMAYFHPFADPLVMAGQGTVALEVLDALPDIDAIVIAIGGGGLMSGMSTALRARKPGVRIIGVEPMGSPTLKASLDAGEVVSLPDITSTIATMSCRRTDDAVFEIVRRNVDDIVLVEDQDMVEASRWLWFETGIAADYAGAAAVAALQRHPDAVGDAAHVCALVCGAGAEGA
ncbi:MAG: threonine ammonia-lyase [Alphaproteobacteria bacterium]